MWRRDRENRRARQTDRHDSFDSVNDPNEHYRDFLGRKGRECELLRKREQENVKVIARKIEKDT